MLLNNVTAAYPSFPELRGLSVALSGSSGFIASHMAALLSLQGAWVVSISRRPLPAADIQYLYGAKALERIHHHRLSVYDSSALTTLILREKPAVFFHFAFGPLQRQREHLEDCLRTEVLPYYRFLECLAPVERVLLCGTCEEYGLGAPPFAPSQKESPVSVYSVVKTMQHYLSRYYANLHGKTCLFLRPFTTYGPLQPEQMLITGAIRACLQNEPFYMSPGLQKRECNFVTDVCLAIMRTALYSTTGWQAYNIGGGPVRRVRDLVYRIRELTGSRSPIIHQQQSARPLEIEDLVTAAPGRITCNTVPVEQGLALTIAYYRYLLAPGA